MRMFNSGLITNLLLLPALTFAGGVESYFGIKEARTPQAVRQSVEWGLDLLSQPNLLNHLIDDRPNYQKLIEFVSSLSRPPVNGYLSYAYASQILQTLQPYMRGHDTAESMTVYERPGLVNPYIGNRITDEDLSLLRRQADLLYIHKVRLAPDRKHYRRLLRAAIHSTHLHDRLLWAGNQFVYASRFRRSPPELLADMVMDLEAKKRPQIALMFKAYGRLLLKQPVPLSRELGERKIDYVDSVLSLIENDLKNPETSIYYGVDAEELHEWIRELQTLKASTCSSALLEVP